jgi:PBSX family phage terminase large subunit
MSKSQKLALWVGAVSGGKTFSSLWALNIAIREANGTGLIVIVGRTLQTIERNIISELQKPELFGDLAAQVVHTTGSNTALMMGRVVHLVGANDVRSEEKIRGSSIEIAYVDEATLLPKGFWEMLLTRLRVKGARLLATTNPGSFNHWLRKDFVLLAKKKNMIVFNFTMHDNPLYWENGAEGPQYIADMEATFAGTVFYDRFIKGLWTNAEGAVFPMWNPKLHTIRFDDMPRIERILGTGIDFGTSNASAALMVGLTAYERGVKRKLVLMDEWRYDPHDAKNHGLTLAPSDQAAAYAKWVRGSHTPEGSHLEVEYHVYDSAAAAFRDELRKYDDILPTLAHKDVARGIGTLQNLLSKGQLLVTDRCEGFLSEVTEYRWDEKATEKGVDDVVKKDDHSLDAARYGIYTTRSEWQHELA